MPRAISPDIRAAVLAALHAGEQPAEVAERHGVPAATVRAWKTRYVTPAPLAAAERVAPAATRRQPTVERQQVEIGRLVLDLLAAKLEASRAIADQFRDREWLAQQPAAELAAAGQWLDTSALAIGDRLAQRHAGDGGPDDAGGDR